MSNALTLSQPGMWTEVHRDSEDMWQIIARHVELTKKIAGHPEVAALFDEAMMALADGVNPGPFSAATDVLRGARQRAADHQRQQGTGPQFTVAPAGNGDRAQAAQ